MQTAPWSLSMSYCSKSRSWFCF